MNKKYPFDPSIRNHIIIALGIAIWVFIFLYYTEPLDVNELYDSEKPYFLSGYASIAGLCYLLFLPVQYYILKKQKND